MDKEKYTAQDIVKYLKTFGFEYTVHGLRKQLELGCLPSFKINPHKKKYFSDTERVFFVRNAVLRMLDFSLDEIRKINKFSERLLRGDDGKYTTQEKEDIVDAMRLIDLVKAAAAVKGEIMKSIVKGITTEKKHYTAELERIIKEKR